MKLQKNEFWLLKGNSTINYFEEFEANVWILFVRGEFKKIKIYHPWILQFLKANFFSNTALKEANTSPITKFHRHFNCFKSIISSVIPFLRKVAR